MTESRVRALTGGSGLASVMLMVIGWVLVPDDPPGPGAVAEQVVRWTVNDRRSLLLGLVTIAFGFALAIVFLAGLRSLCARAEGAPGILATIGWGSMLIAVGIAFVAIALGQTQALLVFNGDPGSVEAFHDARLVLLDMAGLPAAVGMVGFGLVMFRTRYPSRWLGVFAWVGAITQLFGVVALSSSGFFAPSGGASVLGAVGLAAWVAAVSMFLLARPGE